MKTTLALLSASVVAGYPMYKQCDNRWKANPLGNVGGETICKSGCAMSSIAMILADCNITVDGKEANPGSLNAWLKKNNGYTGTNLLVWTAVDQLGLRYKGKIYSRAEYEAEFKRGNALLLHIDHRRRWVLMTGIRASEYLVNDPGPNRTSYPKADVHQASVFVRPRDCETKQAADLADVINSLTAEDVRRFEAAHPELVEMLQEEQEAMAEEVDLRF